MTSYKTALNDAKMNPRRLDDEGTDAAEERFQLSVHIEMAKSRDKLYLEEGISEADIDRTIAELGLENDADFS